VQAYSLRIAPRAQAAPPPAAASAPAPAASKPDTEGLRAQAGRQQAVVYRLDAKDIDALQPDPAAAPKEEGAGEPSAPADAGAPDTVVKVESVPAPEPAASAGAPDPAAAPDPALQAWAVARRAWLLRLKDHEYPTRRLFEAAMLARWQAQAADEPASAPQARTAAALPPQLQGPLVVEQARKRHDYKVTQPLRWTGEGCGCVLDDLSGDVYGFYPFWMPGVEPQPLDFGVLTRVGYFALPFDASGNLPTPLHWSQEYAEFSRVAHRYTTQVDLVIHRNDWGALLQLDGDTLDEIAKSVARNAVHLVDTPLDDAFSRVKRYVPFFAEQPRLGDGVTLFLDPGDSATVQSAAFARFHRALADALVHEMRQQPRRRYALNIVVPDDLIGLGPFRYDVLLELVKHAENRALEAGRISDQLPDRSRTNVDVRFVVLMSEPVGDSKKALRLRIEESKALTGNDRRVVLHKVVGVLGYDSDDLAQFRDDLVYFENNFGGVGFWPVPLKSPPGVADANAELRHVFRIDGSSAQPSVVCRIVCPLRWPLRLAMEGLVVLDLACLGLFSWACRFREQERTFVRVLLAGAVLAVVIGGLLLSCDPALAALREGNLLLLVLVVALTGWAAYLAWRPKVEKP
jgi:hypothetical protein